MTFISHSARLAACLAATILAVGCTTPGSGGPGDGTFIGGLPNRFIFNDPRNWFPTGVPTGTATVPVGSGPWAPFISFSQPTTSLNAVLLQGDLGMSLAPGQSLNLSPTGQGFVLCCAKAMASIDGTLTGNVTIGDNSGSFGNQLQGSSTINGSILQRGGVISPGSNLANPVMTVFGTYQQSTTAALAISVFAQAFRLDVRGTATLSGLLLIYVDDDTRFPTAPFKALTAGHGVQGKFSQVLVVNTDKVKAIATYNATDVTVTLSRAQ